MANNLIELLQQKDVREAHQLSANLEEEVDRKRQELRLLVGEKYVDIIAASQLIDKMKQESSNILTGVNDTKNQIKQIATDLTLLYQAPTEHITPPKGIKKLSLLCPALEQSIIDFIIVENEICDTGQNDCADLITETALRSIFCGELLNFVKSEPLYLKTASSTFPSLLKSSILLEHHKTSLCQKCVSHLHNCVRYPANPESYDVSSFPTLIYCIVLTCGFDNHTLFDQLSSFYVNLLKESIESSESSSAALTECVSTILSFLILCQLIQDLVIDDTFHDRLLQDWLRVSNDITSLYPEVLAYFPNLCTVRFSKKLSYAFSVNSDIINESIDDFLTTVSDSKSSLGCELQESLSKVLSHVSGLSQLCAIRQSIFSKLTHSHFSIHLSKYEEIKTNLSVNKAWHPWKSWLSPIVLNTSEVLLSRKLAIPVSDIQKCIESMESTTSFECEPSQLNLKFWKTSLNEWSVGNPEIYSVFATLDASVGVLLEACEQWFGSADSEADTTTLVRLLASHVYAQLNETVIPCFEAKTTICPLLSSSCALSVFTSCPRIRSLLAFSIPGISAKILNVVKSELCSKFNVAGTGASLWNVVSERCLEIARQGSWTFLEGRVDPLVSEWETCWINNADLQCLARPVIVHEEKPAQIDGEEPLPATIVSTPREVSPATSSLVTCLNSLVIHSRWTLLPLPSDPSQRHPIKLLLEKLLASLQNVIAAQANDGSTLSNPIGTALLFDFTVLHQLVPSKLTAQSKSASKPCLLAIETAMDPFDFELARSRVTENSLHHVKAAISLYSECAGPTVVSLLSRNTASSKPQTNPPSTPSNHNSIVSLELTAAAGKTAVNNHTTLPGRFKLLTMPKL